MSWKAFSCLFIFSAIAIQVMALSEKVYFAKVLKEGTPIYGSIEDAIEQKYPKRFSKCCQFNVSLKTDVPIEKQGQKWLPLLNGEFISASAIEFIYPTTFKGQLFDSVPAKGAGWTVNSTKSYESLKLIRTGQGAEVDRYKYIRILSTKKYKGVLWAEVEGLGWVAANDVTDLKVVKRPKEIAETEKWLDLNLSKQILAAYQGDRLVFATLLSSGAKRTPTKKGLFRIYNRMKSFEMAANEGTKKEYLFESIPFHLYFYKYQAIHGFYSKWNLGKKTTHGCANLSMADAEWIWDWTGGDKDAGVLGPDKDPPIKGNWVWVHD